MRITTHCIASHTIIKRIIRFNYHGLRSARVNYRDEKDVDAIIRGAALRQVRRIDLTFNSANVNGNWRTHYRSL